MAAAEPLPAAARPGSRPAGLGRQVLKPRAGEAIAIYATPLEVQSPDQCSWYHSFDLPGFGSVEGSWDLRGRFKDYTGGFDFAGQRVLDVGTASGFLSFESERAGAREVVSFDKESMLQQRIPPIRGAPWYEDPERWAEENQERDLRVKRGYWLAHRALGSRARAFYGDLFALPTELGDFDVAIVAAILQHVNDPIGALASIVRLRPRTLIVTDRMLEGEAAVARLQARRHKPDPSTNAWWFYSTGAFREVLDMLGYQIEHLGRARYRFAKGGRNVEMTTIVATSR